MAQHAVVTGANRGLGLALAAGLAARGARVTATHRPGADLAGLMALGAKHPGMVELLALEAEDGASIAGCCAELQRRDEPIDLLINNAGFMVEGDSLASLQAAELHRQFQINSVAPMLLLQGLLPMLRGAQAPLVVNISSSLASLGQRGPDTPMRYGYSASKVALNMLTRIAAFELAPLGVTVVAIHPGWVRTDMGGPSARLSPAEAAAAVLDTIGRIGPEQSGRYLNNQGDLLPW